MLQPGAEDRDIAAVARDVVAVAGHAPPNGYMAPYADDHASVGTELQAQAIYP